MDTEPITFEQFCIERKIKIFQEGFYHYCAARVANHHDGTTVKMRKEYQSLWEAFLTDYIREAKS